MAVVQCPVGTGFLDGIQVGPLNVLHQGQFEQIVVGYVSNDGGNGRESRKLGSAKAPFACNELETSVGRPDDNGLKRSVLRD